MKKLIPVILVVAMIFGFAQNAQAQSVNYELVYVYDSATQQTEIYRAAPVAPVDLCPGVEMRLCRNNTIGTVHAMYQTLAGRNPTFGEADYWTGRLDDGVGPKEMALAIINGFGLQQMTSWNFVDMLFQNILDFPCSNPYGCYLGPAISAAVYSTGDDIDYGFTSRQAVAADLAQFFGSLGSFNWSFAEYINALRFGFDYGQLTFVGILVPTPAPTTPVAP